MAAARERLAEARKRRPSWGRLYALEGRLDETEGKIEKAVGNYQAAVERGENSPELIARLVRLLHAQRNYPEAEVALARLKGSTRSADLGRLATLTSALSGERNQSALEAASKKLAADSKDPLDHVLRGRLLVAAQQNKEAESAFRRAVELGPRLPECHLALVAFLAEHHPKKVVAAIKQAERDLPSAVAPLVLAGCYEMAGDRDRADTYFRAALKARPTDSAVLRTAALSYLRRGQLTVAEPLFRKLIDQEETDPRSAAWARRTLALALAATGDYSRYQKALELLDENTRKAGTSGQDQWRSGADPRPPAARSP